VAGDMLSDVLIPLLDPRGTHQVDAYDEALNLLADLTPNVDVVIPGHGSPAIGTQIAARLEADRTYIEELRTGIDSRDPRLNQDWLAAPHQANVNHVRNP
jgi:glyoxylase-like metal-dependent hydrolase (beta-lactamase superfamily II)